MSIVPSGFWAKLFRPKRGRVFTTAQRPSGSSKQLPHPPLKPTGPPGQAGRPGRTSSRCRCLSPRHRGSINRPTRRPGGGGEKRRREAAARSAKPERAAATLLAPARARAVAGSARGSSQVSCSLGPVAWLDGRKRPVGGAGAHTSLMLKTVADARADGGAGCAPRVQRVLHLAMHLGVQGGRSGVATPQPRDAAWRHSTQQPGRGGRHAVRRERVRGARADLL